MSDFPPLGNGFVINVIFYREKRGINITLEIKNYY